MQHLKLLLVLLLLLGTSPINAQNPKEDSLKLELKKNVADTVRVKTLLKLGSMYVGNDLKLTLQYINEAKKFARKANFGLGLAKAYKISGTAYYYQGQFREAMDEWQSAFQVFDSLQNKPGMANISNNIGAVYFEQGDNTHALENYLKSLKLSQQIGDDLSTATAMTNVATVYMDKKATHKLALDYYKQAIVISERIQHTRTSGNIYLNMGLIYHTADDNKQARIYLQKALVNLKESEMEPSVLLGLAQVELSAKDYNKALGYQKEAYKAAVEYENTFYACKALVAQADIMIFLNKNNEAINNYKQAMPIAVEIGANLELRDIYQGLAEAYSQNKRFDSAYKYQALLTTIKDTLFNEDADKRLSVLRLDFELEKKENQITQLTTVNELNDKIIQRQKIIRNLITAGLISLLIFLYIALKQKRRIEKEKKRSEELLLNILPEEVAEELKAKGSADAKQFDEVTVMFTDFKGFTQISEKLTPAELVAEIHTCFMAFDNIITKYNIEKIKTIGDAYMCAGGLPVTNTTNASDVVSAALEIQQFMQDHLQKRRAENKEPFEIRIGIHTGPVVAGIVGVKKFAYDIWGDTVNIASRMESSGEAGKVNISGSTYAIVKDKFTCISRGKIHAKNKGEIEMYFVS